MTAIVGILNKRAAVLAADSALTVVKRRQDEDLQYDDEDISVVKGQSCCRDVLPECRLHGCAMGGNLQTVP